MNKEMVMTAALYPDIQLTILNAEENTRRQELQIQELINKNVDLLIISPNESGPITSIAEEAFNQGIPTIIIDREINSDNYTAFVGADNYQIGKDVASYIANMNNGRGEILEIRGMEGSSPAKDRHSGFMEVLKNYPDLKIKKSTEGKWLPGIAARKAEEAFKQQDFDIVFGHNDVMAQSARRVADSLSIKNLFVVGIDALPNLGMELVEQGVLQASFIYPTGGKKAIEIARDILTRKAYQKQNILGTSVVDSSNVTVLRLQMDQVMAFQDILNRQTSRIKEQEVQFNDQRSLLNVALISLALLVVLSLWLAYYYTMIRRRNAELDHKNKAIENQKEQLQNQNNQIREMNKEVQRATQAKLSFFTNISHEFRTPLTLIQAPVNEILSSQDIDKVPSVKNNLVLVRQNSDRLLRLINQLMDFRKMDAGKLRLNISKVNLHQLIEEIYNAFIPLARQKNIDFSFDCPAKNRIIHLDVDKIDKVLFNILSNAFKFTPQNGSIRIYVSPVDDTKTKIAVADSGPGIPPEKKNKIFKPFYQQDEHRSAGTGIGLSLSKGFIDLHKGEIVVADNTPSGSIFTIILPDNKELPATNNLKTVTDISPQPIIDEVKKDTNSDDFFTDTSHPKPSLLIVEDDEQLKSYLLQLLSSDYSIETASNGKITLSLLEKKQADLVLTDLMMPEMDGTELTGHLKSNIETSHIPVIMLTAKAGTEQKTEGIETGADAYIEKPFDPKYLKVRIKKLIELRRTLRSHYQQNIGNFYSDETNDHTSSIDRKFLSRLHSTLEEWYTNPDFSVEKMSEIVGLSRIHLYRKIKALTNYTPSEYISKFRLHKGMQRLKNEKGNISGIALDVGFTSPAYFTKRFREEFGKTPSEAIEE
jgi:signal transduction histidine kinase/CheY-like chemotaxis protein